MYTMYLNIFMVLYFTTVLASTPLSLTHYSAQPDTLFRSVWQCPLSVTVKCHPERSRRMFRIYFTLRLYFTFQLLFSHFDSAQCDSKFRSVWLHNVILSGVDNYVILSGVEGCSVFTLHFVYTLHFNYSFHTSTSFIMSRWAESKRRVNLKGRYRRMVLFFLPPCWLRLLFLHFDFAQCDSKMSSWAESKDVLYLHYISIIHYTSTSFIMSRWAESKRRVNLKGRRRRMVLYFTTVLASTPLSLTHFVILSVYGVILSVYDVILSGVEGCSNLQ